MILYHSITCELDGECDPPRTVDCSPRLPVVLDGCPIGDPRERGGVDEWIAWDIREAIDECSDCDHNGLSWDGDPLPWDACKHAERVIAEARGELAKVRERLDVLQGDR